MGDLPSVRGYKAILISCDNAKEREAVKESMNLINETIEAIYKDQQQDQQSVDNTQELSVAELLQKEISALKNASKSSSGQVITSIKTGIKGVLLIRLNKKYLDPVRIIQELYQRVIREKLPICRYIVRIIPLVKIFFPKLDLFELNVKELLEEEFPGAILPTSSDETEAAVIPDSLPDSNNSDGPDAVSGEKRKLDEEGTARKEAKIYPQFSYSVLFRKRNCDALLRSDCIDIVGKHMPSFGHVNYRQPRNVVIVEALRNVCGLTLLRDYEDYNEFNIRQFQFKITGIEPVGNNNNNNNNNKPAATAEGNREGTTEGTSE